VKKPPLSLLSFLVILVLSGASPLFADIQAPPQSDQGPTRKLGRGIGNMLYGSTEIFESMSDVNYAEGNSAAFSYGLVRGLGRTFARLGYGVFETVTFPFPTNHGTYKPPYNNNIQWLNSGYSEFPPEVGFETKYDYSRQYSSQSWSMLPLAGSMKLEG
jgi:putative exosortase-associated protein (TIGR04073 family)